MLIAMFVWWIVVAMLAALAVLHLWRGVLSPRTVDIGLLPGTLTARMGYALGVLITGGTVQRLSLVEGQEGQAESGEGGSTVNWVRGTFAALLPMLACAAGIVVVVKWLGIASARAMLMQDAAASFHFSLAGVWAFVRDTLDLMQGSLSAALRSNPLDWRYWVFLYLLICLALRLAPSRARLRPALLALLLTGIVLAVLEWALPGAQAALRRGWPVLSLVVATNLLLLVLTLLARGVVELIRVLRGRPAA
ncbi:MAG TPA: hypothetical protein P5572_04910 [Phycisphaerae bacterium]|nr:hypothetical protein [Phycisphaerales bacterium]HRX84341.1 hypothetical protein [Phycisphaerae bacterium]